MSTDGPVRPATLQLVIQLGAGAAIADAQMAVVWAALTCHMCPEDLADGVQRLYDQSSAPLGRPALAALERAIEAIEP